jgi:uroporphyrinogen-III synthase
MSDAVSENRPVCLNTRPAHQSELLTRGLQQLGFDVVEFPTIQITASSDHQQLDDLSERIQQFDIALFVSRNAVDYAFKYLSLKALPKQLQLGVIGKGTWQGLRDQGVDSQIIPADSYDSEGLLATQNLQQVAGKKVIIFRGQAGRNLLGDTLTARGASVTYCEVYHRGIPQYPDKAFSQLVNLQFPAVAVFTSAEGLQNCFNILSQDECERVNRIPWLLISERMRETAHKLGHNAAIIIAKNASDEGILQALQEWHNTRH